MSSPSPRTDLPKEADQRLAELYQQLQVTQVFLNLRRNFLTEQERALVPESKDGAARLLIILAESRDFSVERALLELAVEAGLLEFGGYRTLRRAIGEPIDEAGTGPRPVWEADNDRLLFQGETVRKVLRRATNVRLVLDAFQELGWPLRIDNPLSGGADSRRLRETVRSLNSGLSRLRFLSDGKAKGIYWQDEG